MSVSSPCGRRRGRTRRLQGAALLGQGDLGEDLVGFEPRAGRPWPGRRSGGRRGSCRWPAGCGPGSRAEPPAAVAGGGGRRVAAATGGAGGQVGGRQGRRRVGAGRGGRRSRRLPAALRVSASTNLAAAPSLSPLASSSLAFRSAATLAGSGICAVFGGGADARRRPGPAPEPRRVAARARGLGPVGRRGPWRCRGGRPRRGRR